MVASFNEAFDKKETSLSQKQAIITIIEKKGKDRSYLENWRPISLINADAKIASKVIATRIIKVIQEIIHSNQTGFVKGRFIGEAARSIIDIKWIIQKAKKFQDYYFSLSLDWDFMIKCLGAFGFGPSLKSWVETFYKNIFSCVINNGICISYFEVQRGDRQGDPLSPYLFIIAAELLAITIRNRTDIQGLKIGQEEFKMAQYADDLTLCVPELECANVFSICLINMKPALV